MRKIYRISQIAMGQHLTVKFGVSTACETCLCAAMAADETASGIQLELGGNSR